MRNTIFSFPHVTALMVIFIRKNRCGIIFVKNLSKISNIIIITVAILSCQIFTLPHVPL